MPEQPSSDLWTDFNRAEAQATDRLEEGYRLIEQQNAIILTELVGLEFVEVDQGIPGVVRPVEDKLKMRSAIQGLFLQPDRREELVAEQGVSQKDAIYYGDPHCIRGPIPERTTQLIEDLLQSISAFKDEDESEHKRGIEVWVGDVYGRAVKIYRYEKVDVISSGSSRKEIPILYMNACF